MPLTELQECWQRERHILLARLRATQIDTALASFEEHKQLTRLRRDLLGPHDCAILDSLDGDGEETLLQLSKRAAELIPSSE